MFVKENPDIKKKVTWEMNQILPPLLCLLPTNRQSGGLWQWAYPQNEKKLLGQVNSPHKKGNLQSCL